MLGWRERGFHRCGPGHRAALAQWYRTPLGRALARVEQARMDEALAGLFGYHLLQVGRIHDCDLLRSSRVSHTAVMDIGGQPGAAVRGEPEALPLAASSLDVLVLPHVLEFSRHPHEVLREAERVLIPEGHLVLLGFNPWSAWMPVHLALQWRGRAPWCGRFLSVARVRDWLALLGLDVVEVKSYFYRPPLQQARFMERLGFLERVGEALWPPLGAGYVLVARKRVATLTPIRPRWRPRRRLVAAPGLKPLPPEAGRRPQGVHRGRLG